MATHIAGVIDIVLDADTRTDVTDDGAVLAGKTREGTPVTVRLAEPATDRLVRDAQLLRPDIYGSPNSVHVAEAARLRDRVRVLEAELERAQRLAPSADLAPVTRIDSPKAV
ncbi:hypothetical protein D9V41_09095 [Aeromicrobium phragmitis]|uniref:Uncharacterized protein n=1 Tax=Aeromicrobium phragmitis TaxID=2478914 RepID=A0A3L8PLE1_9ACTN|nr:hypothetical protein [Aeromicrobium phragmitis]RLV56034.1 hypothetical protein D9V41_09095 [Aeromicrobium phragmitis]